MWPVVIPRIEEMRMKPVLNALTLVIAGAGLSGCGYFFGEDGYFRDRGSDYQTATVEQRMTVPPELQSKPIGDLLPVPGEIRPGSTGKFKLPRPQGLSISADVSEFSLQQNGGERWLLAQRAPASLWPQVRQFFTEYRVPVARESTTLGEIETDWLVFEDSSSNALVRRLMPAAEATGRRTAEQILDRPADVLPSTSDRGLQGTGQRANGQEQRFRLRVEPGVQSGTSEIKVLHMQRSQGSTHADWPATSSNANLERAVLGELESYLNQGGGLDSAALSTVSEAPVAVSGNSLDQDGAGNPVLHINTDFNRAWAAVGQALNNADIHVEDMNRTSGVFYINPQQSAAQEQPGFFGRLFRRGGNEEAQQRVQIRLTPVGSRVQVTVEDSITTSTDSSEARALLSRIQENLN